MTIEILYGLFTECSGIATDTRACRPDSMFVALRGERFDGNRFAADAIAGGCRYALVDDPTVADGKRLLWVDNCLATLQQLARYHRQRINVPVVAITGTNGKTTTKELIAAVLSSQMKVLATEGNLNNHIGVPLTLLKLEHSHEVAVIEMGASKRGDIRELVEIALPDMGIITNIGVAHIEGFGSPEAIRETKGELYDYIRTSEGELFVNGDDRVLTALSEGMRRVFYGSVPDSVACGTVDPTQPNLVFELTTDEGRQMVSTRLVGSYNLSNALAACAVGLRFGIAAEAIVDAVASYSPSNMRSQYKQTEHNELILDTYNANPTSMEAALRDFARRPDQSKLVILGDMKELGHVSEAEHRRIVQLTDTLPVGEAWFCGDRFAAVAPPSCRCFADTDELLAYIRAHLPKGKIILIKGSRSMRLESVVQHL